MSFLWQYEIPVMVWIQQIGTWLLSPMQFFSFLGTEEFFLLILSALYWCIDSRIGLRVALSLLISNTVNGYLKLLFRGGRPYWVSSSIQGLAHESSFGVPSGHAQNSMVVWGTIALGFRKRWVTIVCCLVIFLVGLSRMYLGVHWVSDVLTGWAVGLLLLWVISRLEKPVVSWWNSKKFGFQIFSSFMISFLVVLIGLFWNGIFLDWQSPAAWQANIASAFPKGSVIPTSFSDAFTLAGLWFGMLAGASWIQHLGGYQPPVQVWKKLAAYAVGLIGVVIFWYVLGALFPRGEFALSYALRFLRYSLVGLWIICLAPLVFRKFKLSD